MPSSDFVPLLGGSAAVSARRPFSPLAPRRPVATGHDPAGRVEPVAPVPAPPAAGPEPQPHSGDAPEARGPATAAAPAAPVEQTPAWRAGFAAGQAAARAELEAAQATLAGALEDLAAFQRALRTRYERELLQVALGVARKVVGQELNERPEIWLGMIRAAVQRAVERERIVIRVPPAVAAVLRQRFAALRAALDDVRELEIVEDPALPPGGCLVENRWGEVDIGVESQLAAAEAALLRAEE